MIFPFFFFSFLVWFIRIEGEFRLHGITGRHRMREQLRLEGTFGDHLVQVPCSRQGQPEQVLRAAASWVLSISKDGGFTTSLSMLFQYLTTFMFIMFKWNFMCASVRALFFLSCHWAPQKAPSSLRSLRYLCT